MWFAFLKSQSYNKMGCAAHISNVDAAIIPSVFSLNQIYQRKELIGEGTFGKVYRCINKLNNQEYALKVVTIKAKVRDEAQKQIASLKSQISVLRKLNHPNVVKYFSFDVSPDQNCVEIVLEYASQGSLKDYIQANGAVSEGVAVGFCKQILEGLKYLHSQSVVHRDLKCANILIAANGVLKITDFGTAKSIKVTSNEDIAKLCASLKGTPYYMAPEILKRTGHNSSADIWSFGCTLVQMLSGRPPWTGLTSQFQEIISYIVSGIHPPFPPNLTEQCTCFLESCLYSVANQRLNADELLHHRFIDYQRGSRRGSIYEALAPKVQPKGQRTKPSQSSSGLEEEQISDIDESVILHESQIKNKEEKREIERSQPKKIIRHKIKKLKEKTDSFKISDSKLVIDENKDLEVVQAINISNVTRNLFGKDGKAARTDPKFKLEEDLLLEFPKIDYSQVQPTTLELNTKIGASIKMKTQSRGFQNTSSTASREAAIDTLIAREERNRYLQSQRAVREQREAQRRKWERQLREGEAFLRKEITTRYQV